MITIEHGIDETNTGALVALALKRILIEKLGLNLSILSFLFYIPSFDSALLTGLFYPAATGPCRGWEHD